MLIATSLITTIILWHLRHTSAMPVKEVTVDINKDANNPRKRHYIVNKDIVSIAPPGYTEHIYENEDPFDVTNFYFGRKKLEAGIQELSAKSVEKVGVFWKYETPILLYIKHAPDSTRLRFEYYRLTKHKVWAKVDLTEKQAKSLPLSGSDLGDLLLDILQDLGEIPEDRPLPGIGAFGAPAILLPIALTLIPIFHFL